MFWEEIWAVVESSFGRAGFATATRTDLVNRVGETQFVGAGLQIFEHAVYDDGDAPLGRLFVPQPAIRLNYLDAVAESGGFSTAFVNLCTEQAGAMFEDYLAHLGTWLDCLASIGVPDRDLVLILSDSTWSGGPFRGTAIVAQVDGTDVGDLVFIDDGDPIVRPLLPIVDTSFGLERLTAALNTDAGYSTLLGPLPHSAVPALRVPLDRLRTATLMLMAGLAPSGRGRGRTLRKLATVDLPSRLSLDANVVVKHAYSYWSIFHKAEVSPDQCLSIVRTERERHFNRALVTAVGWRDTSSITGTPTHELGCRLLRSGAPEHALAATVTTPSAPLARPRTVAHRRPDLRSALTVITPTSPIPSHPCTALIRRAIRSLVRHADVVGCRHLIVCDGRPDSADVTEAAYEEYKRQLRKLAASGEFGIRTEIVELDRCEGLGGVMQNAVAAVRTPYLLTYEHDWRLTAAVDTSAVLCLFANYRDVHYVRLNKRKTQEAGWDSVLKPDNADRELALVRTGCWSANPHFARTSHYRRMVIPHLRAQPEGGSEGFEHPVFYAYQDDIHRYGFDRAQRRWGVFILGAIGDPAMVSHLDGRQTVPGSQSMKSGGASSS